MKRSSGFLIAGQARCFWCAVRYPKLLYRSLKTAAVVGTLLVTINFGPALVAGGLPAAAWWKVPLNYLVPFCVATWGALGNARANSR
jgi:hypothetical protein